MAVPRDLFREILWATIFFGLFNAFMMAKGVPEATLFGWLQPLVLKGGARTVFPATAGIRVRVRDSGVLASMSRRAKSWRSPRASKIAPVA